MFSNLQTKILRFLNRVPIKRREKLNKTKVGYKFKQNQESPQKDNAKKGVIIIGIVIFVMVISIIANIVLAILQYSPKSFPGSVESNSGERFDQRIKTIIILSLDRPDESHAFVDGLAVVSYNFDTQKTAIFSINPDLKIYSTRLGKDLFIRTAFNDIFPTDKKIEYFTEGIESLLAIKIDNYIVTDLNTFNTFSKYFAPINISVDMEVKDQDVVNLPDKQSKQWIKGTALLKGDDQLEFLASNNNGRDEQLNRQALVVKKMLLNVFNIQNIYNVPNILQVMKTGFFYTDITLEEFLKISIEIFQLKEGNIEYGFTKAKAYYRVASVTHYPVFGINFSIIDKDIGNVFSDILIFKEQARIELLNGSSVKGLASNRARWVGNTGARIIKVGNSYESEKTTKIYCEDIDKFPKTLNAIQRIFDGKALLINKDYNQRHLGDIIIVIGDDY